VSSGPEAVRPPAGTPPLRDLHACPRGAAVCTGPDLLASLCGATRISRARWQSSSPPPSGRPAPASCARRSSTPTNEPLAPGTRIGPTRSARHRHRRHGHRLPGPRHRARRAGGIKALRPELAGTEASGIGCATRLGSPRACRRTRTSRPFTRSSSTRAQTCIVSEYVRGRTLRECLAEGPLAPGTAIDAVLSVLDAIGRRPPRGHRAPRPQARERHAHGGGHLQGARLRHRASRSARPAADGHVRRARRRARSGTWRRNSCAAARADRRADIFAAGVLLYELVTGRHPVPQGRRAVDVERGALRRARALHARGAGAVPAGLAGRHRVRAREGPRPRAGRLRVPSRHACVASRQDVDPAALPRVRATWGPARRPPSPGGSSTRPLAAIVYWLLLIPVWHVRDAVAFVDWRWLFFTLLAAVCVAPSLRLSLWFVSQQHPSRARAHHARCRPWLRAATRCSRAP
jgi:hypothetical protein